MINELLSLITSFVNFPTWLRNSIYIVSALSLIGVGLAFSPIIALIVAIGLLLVIISLGIYAYVLKARRERQQAALTGGLEQNTLATPHGISDPGRRARLDALRKRFQEGIEKFRSVGKDIYKLPWYTVIGEPAAGKSEAIRRSEIGFPPGMQDEFQGVGGTINMNWWFQILPSSWIRLVVFCSRRLSPARQASGRSFSVFSEKTGRFVLLTASC